MTEADIAMLAGIGLNATKAGFVLLCYVLEICEEKMKPGYVDEEIIYRDMYDRHGIKAHQLCSSLRRLLEDAKLRKSPILFSLFPEFERGEIPDISYFIGMMHVCILTRDNIINTFERSKRKKNGDE